MRLPIAGHRRPVDVADEACALRPCLWVREDPGTFTQGQGYRDTGRRGLICGRRDIHGCPTPVPPPDPEKVRCCRSPDLPEPRHRVSRQRCRRCGTWHTGEARLALVRQVERKPAGDCDHKPGAFTPGVHEVPPLHGDPPGWRCGRCRSWWDHAPEPFEPGVTGEEWNAARLAAWRERMRAAGVPLVDEPPAAPPEV